MVDQKGSKFDEVRHLHGEVNVFTEDKLPVRNRTRLRAVLTRDMTCFKRRNMNFHEDLIGLIKIQVKSTR